VRLETLGQQARTTVGDAPMVFKVRRADGGGGAAPVAVSVDYSGFRDAFGGNYGYRMELVRYPACVLTVPEDSGCSTGTVVADQVNDPRTASLTAVVDAQPDPSAGVVPPDAPTPSAAPTDTPTVPADVAPAPTVAASAHPQVQVAHAVVNAALTAPDPTDSTPPTTTDSTTAVSQPATDSVFVMTAAASSSSGSYAASPLNISASWSVGLQTGAFQYSYPVKVPTPMGGAAPDISLSYDSGSVDGRTSSTNPQASQFGMGWDYQPGFIEREYDSCDREGGTTPDLCYVPTHHDVTLSLNGRTMHLVHNDGTTLWRIQDDPGWKVTRSTTGASNNDDANGEHWTLESPDGTAYYFGRGIGRTGTGAPLTHSTYTVPVYNYDSTCPVSGTTSCKKAWRWNLDYVVDRNSNATTYYYKQETNAYKVHSAASASNYVRGGSLDYITYGYRDTDPLTTLPAYKVLFGTVGRCVQHADGGTTACPTLGPANWTSYPDVPTDLVCVNGSVGCTHYSPSFFSAVMSSTITPEALSSSGTTYTDLDLYASKLDFPDPDGTGPESPTLWLGQMTHEGYVPGTAQILPSMSFSAVSLANRYAPPTGQSPVDQYRIGTIYTETGGRLSIDYGTPNPCSTAVENADPSQNHNDCFPVDWVPSGSSTWTTGWFNKYLVTRLGQYVQYLDEVPRPSPNLSPQLTSEPIVTDYSYVGGAAWHKNEFQLNAAAPIGQPDPNIWNVYRGYQTVSVVEHVVVDGYISTTSSRSVTKHVFYRGMYHDMNSDGTQKTDTVATADFGSSPDYAWLQGREAEVIKMTQGGSVVARTDTTYWSSQTASAEQVGSDTREVAAEVHPTIVQEDTPKADGTFRHHEVVDAFYVAPNATDILNGTVIAHVDTGDSTDPTGATCTNTVYTANTSLYLMDVESTATHSGMASGSNCAGGLLAESLYYYDGHQPNVAAAPVQGNLTCVRAYLTSSASGDCPATPTLPTAPAATQDTYTTYDGTYGRVASVEDGDLHTTSTAYSPTGGRPTSVTVTKPLIGNATTLLNIRDTAYQVTDVNGNVSKMTYDGVGRLVAAYAPTESAGAATGGPATFTATYTVQNSGWSKIQTESLIDIDSGGTAHYREALTFVDGWMRTREVHTVPFGTVGGHLTVQTRYDDTGNVAATTSPYWGSTGFTYGADQTAPNLVPLETRYSYDQLHRQTSSARTVGGAANWGSTTTTYASDTVTTTPPAPAPKVAQTIDIWGRPSASTESTQTGDSTPDSVTSYDYDALGRLVAVYDGIKGATGVNANTYAYDVGGRRTSSTDADAGQSSYLYDSVGNMTSTTDALNLTVKTTYDALNRPMQVYTGADTSPSVLVDYAYDTALHGKGLAASTTVHDISNSTGTWTTAVGGYDVDGRPTSTTYSVPRLSGQSAGTDTYTYGTAYQADGQPASVSYPAIGSEPAETVSTTYEDSNGNTGLPVSTTFRGLGVTNSYTKEDELATRSYDDVHNEGAVSRTYKYEDPLLRLSNIRTDVTPTLNGQPATAQDDTYAYDNANNPTQISDGVLTGPAPGIKQQTCFGYDGLDRLSSAWTQAADCNNHLDTTADGPAGFNQKYGYNPNGTPASQANLGVSTSYTVGGANQPPHAVTGFGGNSYSYDADGQLTTRTIGGVATAETWDALHHLVASIDVSTSAKTDYVNAADGTRIARQDPDGSTTIWLGADEIRVASGNVTDTRYFTLGGTTVAMHSGAILTWLLNDTQNSRQMSVSSNNAAVTRAYYTPYGAARAGSGTLPTHERFLGHILDANGLIQDGARYYDPSLGQFISADPLTNTSDNETLDAYGYGAGNPVALGDPSGLMNQPEGGGGCGSLSLTACRQVEQQNLALVQDEQIYQHDAAYAANGQPKGCVVDNCGGVNDRASADAYYAQMTDFLERAGRLGLDGDWIKTLDPLSAAFWAQSRGGFDGVAVSDETTQAIVDSVLTLGVAAPERAAVAGTEAGADVLLDTSAVRALKTVRGLLRPGETPTVCATTVCEAAANGIRTAGLKQVADGTSVAVRAKVAQQLRGFGAQARGFDGDAVIGATALERGMTLITGDRALWQAVIKLGGDARFFRPGL
jgi:RHS repeat-associated protein